MGKNNFLYNLRLKRGDIFCGFSWTNSKSQYSFENVVVLLYHYY